MTQTRLLLSERQRLAWLRLIRTPNVGPATFRDLINRFGSAEVAIEQLPELMRNAGSSAPRIPPVSAAEAELETARRHGARFVGIGEPDYPAQLRRMDYPPPLLVAKGNGAIFSLPAVAIVGARNASLAGLKMARMLASAVGKEGYAVISGLARGIDTAAHEGSIDTGTVGVLAGGLDRPYPPENIGLCERIAETGAVVTEMPFGWEPRAQDFPRRNRVVAGLALGLVVVEAARRSGSLISARLANEMGRIVFSVPGSPLDPRAEGANKLLKEGAVLVTSAEDILDALAPLTLTESPPEIEIDDPPDFSNAPPPAATDRAKVIEALGPVPTSVDELIWHTGLHPAKVFMILLELDLAGRLERHSGGAVSLVFPDP
ncbi:DNA-processing protein DprA [Mesorhizobium sp. LHD-90]|uniref:DNA-processing protein DprA n=1 Tax=Mesorhizobium sp. LHD-90 TaxID=3071414 RepID=UPI0027E1E376|nr:DNA-processing protein DprA [Mesorhizobium sp. LHD-90]MDQ6438149.1 DNA-processing protein DprA [Mesorhizobium sp. LHD-90]